ncbi:MAG: ATP-dependent RecD-like DNA helicase [Verrucomicrobiota bacterium]|nr:ATP-dependent RecD-like DNA helicase [Verrucomicrobiota bacterium]
MTAGTPDQIRGSIDSVVYAQPEGNFTVARLKEPKKKDLTIIVGALPSVQPGETVVCQGTWKIHPTYGRQFEVTEYTVEQPSDVMGIQKYLESGVIKGIGPMYAEKIVARFGADTLEVLDKAPHRLREIEGLGKKKIENIKACWKAQQSVRNVMLFLRTYGVSPGFAQKIYKAFGEESIEKVKANPYHLAKEVHGIGFKMADSIALKLGYPLQSSERIGAGIEHVLWELSNEGHTCYSVREFLPLAQAMLQVDEALIQKEIERLVAEKVLISDVLQEKCIWLGPFWSYEQGIAKDVQRLLTSLQAIRAIDAEKAADWVQGQLNIQFAFQQKRAVIAALTDKVHIITGGPGTGKSTITNSILTITSKLTDKVLLAAPTGRAAKRLSQITRRNALTIHALLEMNFEAGGFKRGKENPLDCDLIVIDEASMIDTPLLFHLLRAIPNRARVLFVGDIDQLPSVGPGTVLRDLIASGLIGVTCLTEIFRQAKGSKIITNAHKINQGEFPEIYTDPKSDFHFIEAEVPEAIQQIILQLVAEEIPKTWKFHPTEEIQVLSPMKRGAIGVEMLNDALQTLLNPSSKALLRAGKKFCTGDKVMQIKNDYDKKIYNGDIGRVTTIDLQEELLTVDFDGRPVEYDFSELEELVLAYACSIHKFQGSECPCVVIPIHTSHFKLLQRNLLYTGVTRGKRQVYLVGTKKAIALAIHNDQVQKRYTGLIKALKNAPVPAIQNALQLDFNSL